MQQFITRRESAILSRAKVPPPGARVLPHLSGLRPNGTALLALDSIYADATRLMLESSRFFRYGSCIVFESRGADSKCLTYLTHNETVRTLASNHLANVFSCAEVKLNHDPNKESQTVYFNLPDKNTKDLLTREPTKEALPVVNTYAFHPVITDTFQILNPGYHAEEKTLVHGPTVEPTTFTPADPTLPIMERLPPHLRELLRGFPFLSDADAANAIAAIITSVMASCFVLTTKPIVSIDGNQPGVGKSVLARVVGWLLTGELTPSLKYTEDDEELEKKVIGTLASDRIVAAIIIDNARLAGGAPIGSPFLESMSTSPEIRGRILGSSSMFTRPNDLMLFITMNDTRLNRDMTSRCLPIRLSYVGDASQRDFGGHNPEEYLRTHRLDVLAEIYGLIVYWLRCGRPEGARRHRCNRWAAVVGGIMEACGYPEFLENAEQAAADFNTQHEELAGLAEVVYRGNNFADLRMNEDSPESQSRQVGRTASGWKSAFSLARILQEELQAAKSDQARATRIGNFLGSLVERKVSITIDDVPVSAELCRRSGSSNATLYYFRFSHGRDGGEEQVSSPSGGRRSNPGATASLPRELLDRQHPNREPPVPGGIGNTENWR